MSDHGPCQVFVVGKEALAGAAAIRKMVARLRENLRGTTVVVIPAIDQAIPMLDQVARAHTDGDEKAATLGEQVRADHFRLADELLGQKEEVYAAVNDLFVEMEWLLEDEPHPDHNYTVDQLAGIAYLASSKIIAMYLDHHGIPGRWLDSRDVIVTDNGYGEAHILEEESAQRARSLAEEVISGQDFVLLTQGGIGSTTENFTTTLGEQGLTKTALLFARCFGVENIVVWEDDEELAKEQTI